MDVEKEDRWEPWSHEGSSLKISDEKKKCIHPGCLPCPWEPSDSLWVNRENQTTEGTWDRNMRKRGKWALKPLKGWLRTSSLRNTDMGDNIVSKWSVDTHGTPAEQDLPPNALTKLNWKWISSGPRAHSGGRHGNLLQYSCLENPTGEPGGLQSTGLLHRVRSTWHTCTRAHGPNEILFQ